MLFIIDYKIISMSQFLEALECCLPCCGKDGDTEINNNNLKVIIKSRCCRKEKVIININHSELLEEDLDKFLVDVKKLIMNKNQKYKNLY